MRSILRGICIIGFAGCLLLLGIAGWDILEQKRAVQAYEAAEKQELTEDQEKEKENKEPPETVIYKDRYRPGEKLGKLEIPRLSRTVPVIEGSDVPTAEQLARGVGHHHNSVLPGEADNTVLAGHRETAFKDAGKIEKGDKIIIETQKGQFTYQVKKMKIVDDDDRGIVVSLEKPMLTLYTCYPFEQIGFAPQRYVITAELTESRLK